jgi:hypothetical protein
VLAELEGQLSGNAGELSSGLRRPLCGYRRPVEDDAYPAAQPVTVIDSDSAMTFPWVPEASINAAEY